MKRIMSYTRFVLLISLIHYFTISLFSEEWTVPTDQSDKTAPFLFTAESVQKGADLFMKNCQSCHGNPGKANYANMDPSPGDPASEKFQKLTDGDMFYKITNGRGTMPQFKMILSEEDRWDLVSYIRSFHTGYIQPEPEVATMTSSGDRATMTLLYDSLAKMVTISVYTVKNDVKSPVKGAEVLFFIKRYFGNLPVGEGARTNEEGIISYPFPEGIVGDSIGQVALIAQLNESSGYGNAKKTIMVPLGVPTEWVSLTADRAMWNINFKAPVWLILSYSLTVLGVFITLIYIALQIRKIFLIGTDYDDEQSEKS
ncbi:MAG: c-type cytochrome [Bacteroidales bacterium]|nr:c-type cytochrome [Bacteroidales bacterium]